MTTMVETSSRSEFSLGDLGLPLTLIHTSSTSLPSISNLDASRSRHDDHYRPRHTLPSPSFFRFEAGSQDKTSPTLSKSVSNLNTTPAEEQRSTSTAPVRHSLPSIQEALGREPARPYNGPPAPSPMAVPVSTSTYFTQPNATAPPAGLSRRPSPSTYPPSASTAPQSLPPPAIRRSSFTSSAAQGHKNPSIQPIQTGHSPPFSYARSSGNYTPGSYSPSPHSAPVHATYPYSSTQAHYPPAPPSATLPHSSHGGVMSAAQPHPSWAGESGFKSPTRQLRAHDSSVKRGLDQFDVEASFYELLNNGKRIYTVSEDGAHKVRDAKMNGDVWVPSAEQLESMSDAMANMQRAFHRIQEISHAHHAEAQEHQKEMRRHYEGMAGDPSAYLQDGHGGGIGMPADAKKRRGRAAPPGRCHSCNRAETPEWRRGPDGARTLCNACGLRKLHPSD